MGRRRAAPPGSREGGEEGEGGGRAQIVIRVRRFQVPFPNILDRYVFRIFAWDLR